MRTPVHPRAVGAFVLGGVALFLAAIVLLSSKTWLVKTDRYCVVFPGSVKGLTAGAQVTFRGVKIGEVRKVRALLTERRDEPIVIEVTIEIVRDVVEAPVGLAAPFEKLLGRALADELVRRGVRARMLSASLLTGQKYIDLDFLPDEPARFSHQHLAYPELPTTPTAMEKLGAQGGQFLEKLADLPLDRMLDDVRQVIQALREIIASPDAKALVGGVRRSADALAPFLAEAREAIADARRLTGTLESEVHLSGPAARGTLTKANKALDRVEASMGSLGRTLDAADDARVEAGRTIEEMRRAMAALRSLVDYIQTHPEAVLLGKEPAKEKP
jgi:phospholipid/cholesterol/gamma-HCH transport system substrate-binding protein